MEEHVVKTSGEIHTLATVQQTLPAETVVCRHLWTQVDRLRDMS